ncbi:DUF5788 family protein [Methanocella arvoryzae]|uniref:Uncharacterized protein n=1 Tax=Methanocella arvoryzae (strain DSM 22066 / NBRC 105507 / MRE50) TaxID=351160 RepID=Q0W0Q0_METAR|nr:DUF5788 family protein [Methanocella arvoryzae]CAJ38043.1 conserved hypothetical protein [Methanocella arvoryzae MRE50]
MKEDRLLSKIERDNYIIRLQKEFASTGATIPDSVAIDGKTIRLRTYVFEILKKKGNLTPEEQEEADRTAALLQKKRRELVSTIATAQDMTQREAEELFNTILGIDRALDTLYRIHEPRSSAQEEAKKAKVQDGRRWLNLVKKIYSRGDEKAPRERS